MNQSAAHYLRAQIAGFPWSVPAEEGLDLVIRDAEVLLEVLQQRIPGSLAEWPALWSEQDRERLHALCVEWLVPRCEILWMGSQRFELGEDIVDDGHGHADSLQGRLDEVQFPKFVSHVFARWVGTMKGDPGATPNIKANV